MHSAALTRVTIVACTFCLAVPVLAQPRILVDTDFQTDVDDAVALTGLLPPAEVQKRIEALQITPP